MVIDTVFQRAIEIAELTDRSLFQFRTIDFRPTIQPIQIVNDFCLDGLRRHDSAKLTGTVMRCDNVLQLEKLLSVQTVYTGLKLDHNNADERVPQQVTVNGVILNQMVVGQVKFVQLTDVVQERAGDE